eukprot:6393749-Ditylum_brightwellii.AAC.1
MSFGWKITTKAGNLIALHPGLSYPYDYLFHTLDPDWDTIAQIVPIINEPNLHAELKHVKGCQDKNKLYEELSLPAQLNIDVDAQAMELQSSYRKSTQ